MDLPSKYLNEAVEQFASLPSIGKRSALRLVLDLLKRSPEQIDRFSNAVQNIKDNINYCINCGNISDDKICVICANPSREHRTVCVVEDIRDILAIEATRSYQGIYHVLGGVISPMDGQGPEDLNIPTLLDKVENGKVDEIIFALSSTMEGDTTNFYIYKKISPTNIKVTTLSRGVSIGSELHYADELTLGRSILQRLPFESTFKSK
ncbi:recombination mediator RecR [Brumimicrobium aurantiacum]|uniref:Recombination protein RecR n=1 Tax=Brumimicrobium aurantiacum TaxID=1737063 RepID=A0A3E1EUC5_9FLAO|nr:recombination mediator RecR [Brumimicrobium aurantiacum]RFC53155.1 recombination protein RecR [Brumimicrobium aurantiacum]